MENVLNLAEWTILDTKETDQGYQFVAVYAIEPLCVYCHSSDIQRFGKKEQLFLDLSMHGRRLGVQVQRRTLTHDRYVLLRRRHDLDVRGQLILAAWTQTFLPMLARVYEAKEGFYDIWNAVGEQEARTQYQDWRKQFLMN